MVTAAVPRAMVNAIWPLAALELAASGSGPDLVMVALRLHATGTTLASVFWGLWLLPFGALVIRGVTSEIRGGRRRAPP